MPEVHNKQDSLHAKQKRRKLHLPTTLLISLLNKTSRIKWINLPGSSITPIAIIMSQRKPCMNLCQLTAQYTMQERLAQHDHTCMHSGFEPTLHALAIGDSAALVQLCILVQLIGWDDTSRAANLHLGVVVGVGHVQVLHSQVVAPGQVGAVVQLSVQGLRELGLAGDRAGACSLHRGGNLTNSCHTLLQQRYMLQSALLHTAASHCK